MPMKRHGPELSRVVAGIPQRLKAQIPDALNEIGTIIEAETKRLLLTPGRGRLRGGDQLGVGSFRRVAGKLQRVKRGVPRTKIDLTNRASAPGDPPAPDMGTLQRSITHELIGESSVRVGTNVEYAEPLEFGTVSAGRGRRNVILPRPFLRPAVSSTKPAVNGIIVRLLKTSVSK